MAKPAQPSSLPDFREPSDLDHALERILYLADSLNQHAYRIGRYLTWVRKKVGHGNYGPWFAKHVDRFDYRTGGNYMAYARQCLKSGQLIPYTPGKSEILSDEWYSPLEIINPAREVVGDFDLDPASCAKANERVKAKRYYSLQERGENGLDLKLPWEGRLWINPPYLDLTQEFIDRLETEYTANRVTEAILLLNTQHTSLPWFDWLWEGLLCFPIRRLPFLGPNGKQHFTREGQVVVYVGPNEKRFKEVFNTASDGGGPIGHIVKGTVQMVNATPEQVARFDAAAAKMGITRAEWMQQVFRDAARARKAGR